MFISLSIIYYFFEILLVSALRGTLFFLDFAHFFLQCFFGFEPNKLRTRARGGKRRNSRHFSFPNRAWERSGDPKSRLGGPVRTAKREKDARRQAIFFLGGRTTPVERRKRAAEAL